MGLTDFIDEFAGILRTAQFGHFERFPFPSLSAANDGPWEGICRAMDSADAIHFSLRGMAKEHFQRWLRNGCHRYEPVLAATGWTNRELYDVLTVESLRMKTTFYGGSGETIDEPHDWLALS